MGKYTVLTSSNRKQLHVVKTTVADPADGDWDSVDASHSPVFANTIESYWGALGLLETPDVDNIQSDAGSAFGEATGDDKQAQSFTSVTGLYKAFQFRLLTLGSPTDGVRASLQGDNAGEPDGLSIDSVTIDSSDIIGSFSTFTLNLTKPVPVSSSDVYWLVWERTGILSDANRYQMSVDSGSNYANGARHVHATGGSWGGAALDMNFAFFLARLHIATQESDGQILYHLFDPGTDTWTIVNEFAAELGLPTDYDTIPDQAGVTLAVRNDSDVVIVWYGQRASDGNDSMFWARRESGVWTRANLNVGSTVKRLGPAIGPDEADRIYIIYTLGTSGMFSDTIKADNSLVTVIQILASVDTAALIVYPGFIDLTGRTVVGCIAADNELHNSRWSPNDTPTSISQDSDIGNFAVFGHGRTTAPFVAACLAADGDTIHVLYASDVDQDIYHNNSGGGPLAMDPLDEVEAEDAVTCNRISCYVNGNDLNYIYDDGGTTKYGTFTKDNEPLTTLSGGILGQQNYYAGPFEA